MAKLTESAKAKENTERNGSLPDAPQAPKTKKKRLKKPHKPTRIHRTVISSMKNSADFGAQMKREAKRRKFDQASR